VLLLYTSLLLGGALSCEYSPTKTNTRSIEIPTPKIEMIILNKAAINFLRSKAEISFQPEADGINIDQTFSATLSGLSNAQQKPL
jgi:hypothetical protein